MTEAESLASLRAAYDAANSALERAQDLSASTAVIARLDDAADLALRSLAQAMKETLTIENQHMEEIKQELDQITTQLKNDLKQNKSIVAMVETVDKVVKLAAALASAFA